MNINIRACFYQPMEAICIDYFRNFCMCSDMTMGLKLLLTAFFSCTIITQALADDQQKRVQLVGRVIDNVHVSFMIAYQCRDALGTTYYNAIRTYAEKALQKIGSSPEVATQRLNKLEKSFESDKKLGRKEGLEGCV
ncbi:hypothetical protein HGP17_07190 [Rhizobium sp. P38BS-XIX]|uniref:hypothetical protein n=1 Tax=Rhizobium sp. P38BS-XIX TaxID=2726740 RepID=UPI0014569CC7|nr:hypothetical protein [Rhizobium sp. P38BS-XIX]NLR96615.1 hypothetical protein [Rhizobium sp. P38BS-XIX]